MTTRRTGLSVGFALLLATVAGSGWVLAERAQEAILESRSGSVSAFSLDPDAPGFRAFTEPTPCVLVVHTAVGTSGAELVGASILTAADAGEGGTVVSVPATFRVDAQRSSIGDVFATVGLDAAVDELRTAIDSNFTDVVVLDGSSWTSLMRADLPLTLTLDTALTTTNPEGVPVRLVDPGTREFELLDVARIATHRNPGEPALGITLRHQQIWQSWIARTAGTADRPELFELDTGFSSVIGALASGEVSYRVLPATTLVAGDPSDTSYLAQTEEILDLFAQIVPFPVEATPGDRPSVMVLRSSPDGSEASDGADVEGEDVAASVDAAIGLVTRSGGRVTILGNTELGGTGDVEIQLHDAAGAGVAAALADAFGITVTDVPLSDATTTLTVIVP